MTFHEAKKVIAQKYGYDGWRLGENAMLTHISNVALINERLDEAAEFYAEIKWKEACKAQKWECERAANQPESLSTRILNAKTAQYVP